MICNFANRKEKNYARISVVVVLVFVFILGLSMFLAFRNEMRMIDNAKTESMKTEQQKYDERYESIHTNSGREVIVDKKNDKKYILDDNGDIMRIDGQSDKEIQMKF